MGEAVQLVQNRLEHAIQILVDVRISAANYLKPEALKFSGTTSIADALIVG